MSWRIVSIGLVLTGLVLIANATLPILFYEFFTSARFSQNLLSPVPQRGIAGVSTNRLDLTRASNWFVGEPELPAVPTSIRYYTVSIPKLSIEDAAAEIGGDDLSRNLIHYGGTALPGRPGNAVIFGHSVLPQFFNPQNYLTIFSTLPKLKVGDEVVVSFDGITYRYKIFEMFEVEPENISVLAQTYDDSYLTLITCVPPGTYLRRLVVKARIIPPPI